MYRLYDYETVICNGSKRQVNHHKTIPVTLFKNINVHGIVQISCTYNVF